MNVTAKYGVIRTAAAPLSKPLRFNASKVILYHRFATRSQPWCCPECSKSRRRLTSGPPRTSLVWKRGLSQSTHRRDDFRKSGPPYAELSPADQPTFPTSLPSKTDQRRWQFSKRLARMMDKLLAKAFLWGQHINVYTGTDYSGIETLRKEIDTQEESMKDCHDVIDKARAKHHEAHAKQGASQKEIVSLLERKSSWSPEDLERYMSLVRSEHTDEQAVQGAKDGLHEAERDLENTRAELERLERKQYHEEQIWSDTIRRNSTWVTFGLMGVNIVLLLAQITIFEPYRRRKIVRDVNQALDEKALLGFISPVEKQIDEVVAPEGVSLEAVEDASIPAQPLDAFIPVQRHDAEPLLADGAVLQEEIGLPGAPTTKPKTWSARWEHYTESLQDLFSERTIQVKKVDITTKALQGAATGVATMGLLFVLWRPK